MSLQCSWYSGNLNGAVSSNVVRWNSPNWMICLLTIDSLQYRAKDKPWYTLGHGIVLAYIGIGVLTSVVYYLVLRAENARRDQGTREEIIDGVNDNGISIYCHACPPPSTDSFPRRRRSRDRREADRTQRKVPDGRGCEKRKRKQLERVPIYFVKLSGCSQGWGCQAFTVRRNL